MPPRDVPARARPEPRDLTPEDYDMIREAVMETPRGRWFLDQFASRLRSAETARLSEGLQRIERAVSHNHDALMARLSAALAGEPQHRPAPQAPLPETRLAPRHMKFFRADEDIFEPAPHAQIAAVPSLPQAEAPLAETPEAAPAKRRIIIIRHKPGEEIDVPLTEDLARAS